MTGNPTPLVRGYIDVNGATTLKSTLDAVDSITITSASAFGSPQLILTNTNRDPEADWHLQSRGDTGNFTIYDPSGSPRFYIDETGGEVNVAVDLVVGGTINSGAITTTDDIVINKNGGSLAIDVFKFSDWADQFVFEKNTAGNGFWHFQTLDARTTARSNNLFIWGAWCF